MLTLQGTSKKIKNSLSTVDGCLNQIRSLSLSVRQMLFDVDEELKGKVFIHKGREYVFRYSWFHNDKLCVNGDQISKQGYAYLTSTEIVVSEEGSGYGPSNCVNAKFNDVLFVKETYEELKLRRLEKEMLKVLK